MPVNFTCTLYSAKCLVSGYTFPAIYKMYIVFFLQCFKTDNQTQRFPLGGSHLYKSIIKLLS